MWPYRDWLIRSINADMPLDQMTVEQLAGDLLPNATTDQLIATAFHRNTMSNDEGGTDDEEFRTIAVKGPGRHHPAGLDGADRRGVQSATLTSTIRSRRPTTTACTRSLIRLRTPTGTTTTPRWKSPRRNRTSSGRSLTARIADLNVQLKTAKAADAQRDDQRWQIPAPGRADNKERSHAAVAARWIAAGQRRLPRPKRSTRSS
jgi:hypothetical protein